MKKKVHAGFSIIEIMVALGIVLSMAVAILPVGNNYFALGRNSSSKTGVATLATAISQYKFETGEYPLNLNSLTVSNEQYGPYISSAALRDPWNQNYNYSYNDNSFAVWSNGPDKKIIREEVYQQPFKAMISVLLAIDKLKL
mgnify:CR=1 FL=1